jgi:hypothetical protein
MPECQTLSLTLPPLPDSLGILVLQEYHKRVPPKLSRSSLRTSSGCNKDNQSSNSDSNMAAAKEADPVRKEIEEKLSLEVMRSASLGGPDLCPETPTPARQNSPGTSYHSPTTESGTTRSSEDGAGRTSLKHDNTKMLAGNVLQHVGWAGKSNDSH